MRIMRRSFAPALALVSIIMFSACTGAASGADPAIKEQYLVAARTAGNRVGLDIADSVWIEIADTVCQRQLLTDADYAAFVEEMEQDAPNPALGRVMKDVGRTAISLFCPA